MSFAASSDTYVCICSTLQATCRLVIGTHTFTRAKKCMAGNNLNF